MLAFRAPLLYNVMLTREYTEIQRRVYELKSEEGCLLSSAEAVDYEGRKEQSNSDTYGRIWRQLTANMSIFQERQYLPMATCTMRKPMIRPFEYESPRPLTCVMAKPPAAAIPDYRLRHGQRRKLLIKCSR
jgi:hypothetical protein